MGISDWLEQRDRDKRDCRTNSPHNRDGNDNFDHHGYNQRGKERMAKLFGGISELPSAGQGIGGAVALAIVVGAAGVFAFLLIPGIKSCDDRAAIRAAEKERGLQANKKEDGTGSVDSGAIPEKTPAADGTKPDMLLRLLRVTEHPAPTAKPSRSDIEMARKYREAVKEKQRLARESDALTKRYKQLCTRWPLSAGRKKRCDQIDAKQQDLEARLRGR